MATRGALKPVQRGRWDRMNSISFVEIGCEGSGCDAGS